MYPLALLKAVDFTSLYFKKYASSVIVQKVSKLQRKVGKTCANHWAAPGAGVFLRNCSTPFKWFNKSYFQVHNNELLKSET